MFVVAANSVGAVGSHPHMPALGQLYTLSSQGCESVILAREIKRLKASMTDILIHCRDSLDTF